MFRHGSWHATYAATSRTTHPTSLDRSRYMEFLVVYDVSTSAPTGQTRLKRVAKVMEAYGQRVQQSVFECILAPEQMVLLQHDLDQIIDKATDSVRIYRLREPHKRYTRLMGRQIRFDIRDPLVL